MNNTGMRVSPDKIGRPDFTHGTLGKDMNPTCDKALPGNVIDKYQRGEIQSFSKNAHFRMGGSDHFKRSTQTKAFVPKDNSVNLNERPHIDQMTKEMKASHFNIGKKNGDMVNPAPVPPVPSGTGFTVKQLSMEEAKQRLGEAHWDHGQAKTQYNSINKLSFTQPENTADQASRKKDIWELKSRISASSVTNHPVSADTRKLLYQTNSLSVHKPLDAGHGPDKEAIHQQKLKLSKSNFRVGHQPITYSTTNKSDLHAKPATHYTTQFRQETSDKNVKTNFTHTSGFFEKPQHTGLSSGFPGKSAHDDAAVKEKIADLKSVHFGLGKDPAQFAVVSSKKIGEAADMSQKQEAPAWASMKSNFGMGSDGRGKLTDYQTRYKNTHWGGAGDPSERMANKDKIHCYKDAVYIKGDAKTPVPITDEKFKDAHAKSSQINTYLTPFAADNIRGTHFTIGINQARTNMSSHTEQNSKFMKTDRDGQARWCLSPERIQFFKDAHFKTGSADPQLDKFHEKTNQRVGFPTHGSVPKQKPDECSAFNLRHGSTNLGSTDKKFPTPYVTGNSLTYKWVQPQFKTPAK